MKITTYFWCRLAGVTVSLCFSAVLLCCLSTRPALAEKISLTGPAPSADIIINIGDELEVTLEGNPTTGYVWEKVEDGSKILVLQNGFKYIPAQPQMIGSGGKFVFSLRGTASGKARLRFIYHRTFEKNIPPLTTWEATITVK